MRMLDAGCKIIAGSILVPKYQEPENIDECFVAASGTTHRVAIETLVIDRRIVSGVQMISTSHSGVAALHSLGRIQAACKPMVLEWL